MANTDCVPDVSIIVVSFNTAHLLEKFFAALESARGSLCLQIIVVDNASCDGSVERLRARIPHIKVIENKRNIGFGRANNQALPYAAGRYVLLLNVDAFVSGDTLQKSVEFMDVHPKFGILGVRLTGKDGELQPCCRYFPTPWNVFVASNGLRRVFPYTRLVDDFSWDHSSVRECDWVPGCYYLVRREVIDRIGLFDPRYFVYYEEVDHCYAARVAGWKVAFFPFTTVVHIGAESAKSSGQLSSHGRQLPDLQIESELLYFRKHFGVIGLVAFFILNAFSNLFFFCKRLVKKGPSRSAVRVKSLSLLQIALRTRIASRPSR
jgi:GT2 family glycosyltransferase